MSNEEAEAAVRSTRKGDASITMKMAEIKHDDTSGLISNNADLDLLFAFYA